MILISDTIDDEASIASGLQHFRHNRHEVVGFHVVDDAELTFPFDRLTRFKDIEGVGRLTANPKQLRQRYLSRIHTFQENLEATCFERTANYEPANTSAPYDQLPAAFLEKRSRVG